METLKSLSYNCCFPYIVYNVPADNYVVDPFFDLTNRMNTFHISFHRIWQKNRQLMKKASSNQKKLYCYEEMQEWLDKSPEKYFQCEYDWYYTGGCMDVLPKDGGCLLFYPRDKSKLVMVELMNDAVTWDVQSTTTLAEFEDNSPIYQTETFRMGNKILTGTRCKYKYYIHTFCDDTESKDIDVDTLTMKKSCVSSSLNKFSKNQLVMLDVEHVLKIWDLTTRKYIKTEFKKLERDSFGQIKCLSEHTVGFLNRTEFIVYDKRVSGDSVSAAYKNLKKRLTSFCTSQSDDNICYLTTYDSTLLLDLRTNKAPFAWQHITHGIPYLCDSIRHDDKNIVCVSSPFSKDKYLLGHDNEFYYIPNKLPSVNESLDDIILSNVKLNKLHLIKNRTNLSTVAIKLVEVNNDMSVFSVNSLGDLFVNEIGVDKPTVTDKFVEWNDSFQTQNQEFRFVDKVITRNLDKILVNKEFELWKPENFLILVKDRFMNYESKMTRDLMDTWFDLGLENEDEIEKDIEQWVEQSKSVMDSGVGLDPTVFN